MKPKRNVLAFVAACALVPAVVSQVAVTPTETPAQVVKLSPFVVDSTSDRGYQATSTLAGNRIKTDLKDVAASVTVLTKEFMDDLGATTIHAAMTFVAGAETDSMTDFEQVGTLGAANGYVGTDFGDNNNNIANLRVRGVGGASFTQNFMPVMGSTDRYNVERVEFLRGANSVLFGLSSPAGLLNFSSKVITRTNSPYFSPNKAVAPICFASSIGTFLRSSSEIFSRIFSFTMRSTFAISSLVIAAKCEKSKRKLVALTIDPFCATCVPTILRKAACKRCVAV